MTNYPLARKLAVRIYDQLEGPDYIYAADLERELEQAIVVYTQKESMSRIEGVWAAEGDHDVDSTHRALLVAIEPIAAADTAESLLREAIKIPPGDFSYKAFMDWKARAKELLARSSK